ncbi:nucleotidyltransferase domain-containing protein [bacterium]|nr:nucleotidyltransferase domain-containing protein [bacterium]
MKRLSDIETKLKKFLELKVSFAFLYGSVLTDYFRADSDIDVAIYLGGSLTQPEVHDLQDQLSELFMNKYDFDLVVLDTADPILAMQVLANGKLINNEAATFVRYKAHMISQYLDFKMSRKIIEDRMAEGSVYG